MDLTSLEKDLEEQTNLIKDQPELVDELLKLHRRWIDSVGDR